VEKPRQLARSPRRIRQALPVPLCASARRAAQPRRHALPSPLLAAAEGRAPRRLPAQLHRGGGGRGRCVQLCPDGHKAPWQPELDVEDKCPPRATGA